MHRWPGHFAKCDDDFNGSICTKIGVLPNVLGNYILLGQMCGGASTGNYVPVAIK